MGAIDDLYEVLRKQRVLFFALKGLETGDLSEDEQIGLFEMAADIADQLEEVGKSFGREMREINPHPAGLSAHSTPESQLNWVELIYKNKNSTIIRKLTEDDNLDEVVRQILFLLEGATYSEERILQAMNNCVKNIGGCR